MATSERESSSPFILTSIYWHRINPQEVSRLPRPVGNTVHLFVEDVRGRAAPKGQKKQFKHRLVVRMDVEAFHQLTGLHCLPGGESKSRLNVPLKEAAFAQLLSKHKFFEKLRVRVPFSQSSSRS